LEDHHRHATHVVPMGNYVIGQDGELRDRQPLTAGELRDRWQSRRHSALWTWGL